MSDNPITVGSFKVYLRHLKQDLLHDRDASILSEPVIDCLIHERLTETYALFFNKDSLISDVAVTLYHTLDDIYTEYPVKEYIKHDADDIHLALEIKVILKVIKYACTIFYEVRDNESIFHTQQAYSLFLADDDLCPYDWDYLNNDQFTTKILYSIGNDNLIARICPVTNYRPTNVFDIHNGFASHPLFIINEEIYERSIKNMISKYILKDDEEAIKFSSSSHADCFYIGKLAHKFETTCSENLAYVAERFKELLKSDYSEYEVIFAIEYIPMRAYGVSINIRLFLFTKEKDLGYILNTYICGNVKDRFYMDYLGINARQEFLEEDILAELTRLLGSQVVDDEFDVNADPTAKDSPEKKAYKLAFWMEQTYKNDKPRACIPDFIIYP